MARRSLGEGGSLIPFAPFGRCNAKEAAAIVRCASTVGDRGHKENAIAVIRVAIRDSRIATFANKLVWVR